MNAKYRLQLKIDRVHPPKIGATSNEETTESLTEITVLLPCDRISRGAHGGAYDHLLQELGKTLCVVSDLQNTGVGETPRKACLDWINQYYTKS